jgi:acetyltransferase-like isoleucine patch superfamily enzyme
VIHNKVWLSNYVNVLRGSIINENVVVGAMSLVKGELAKGHVYAGVPCKPVKKLEP